jgi:hypothetical protein
MFDGNDWTGFGGKVGNDVIAVSIGCLGQQQMRHQPFSAVMRAALRA